jgi:glutathione S-transferase
LHVLTLVIGNKQLSSWSLRPWILLKHLGLPFREVRLTLDTPGFKAALGEYSPAGRVPVLIDGDLHIWDSLSIIEYLHEQTATGVWPREPLQRAHARSISAEMHSGFAALREHWPMRAASRNLQVPLPSTGLADVSRIDELWQDCRSRFGAEGPWLFGNYSAADAMYAPVVLRFNTYGAVLSAQSSTYARHVLDDPDLQQWLRDAQAELTAAGEGLGKL